MDPLGRSGTAFGVMQGQRPRDIAGDIRRRQRQRQLKRALLVLVLFLVLLALGFAVKVFADNRARASSISEAQAHFVKGTDKELREAIVDMQAGVEEFEAHPSMQAGLAVARAQLFAEFGDDEAEARAAVEAVQNDVAFDAVLARGLLAAADGDVTKAREAVDTLAALGEPDGLATSQNATWLRGFASVVEGGVPSDDLLGAVAEASKEEGATALRRLHARLVFQAGDGEKALEILNEARQRAAEHVGLAADEVLYNALLGQRYGGVADIADQLLEGFELSTRDRAHARLARAVVHVHAGEVDKGSKLLSEAFGALAPWETRARTVALETALAAADVELTREILAAGEFDEQERGEYEAWLELIDGDVMAALDRLAKLEQAAPRVALLQGLALVEQARWAEAAPWLERAQKLLPGRIDVEVARARVEIREGDPEQALRKLEAMAEEEPYAPRAWTGLGEAILAVHEAGKGRSRREAERAFQKAIDRERLPAEAAMRLGEVLDAQRAQDGSSAKAALEAYEKAVEINDRLPRYRARLGLYLEQLGFLKRAETQLEKVADRKGIAWPELVALARVKVINAHAAEKPLPEIEPWLNRAEELGAPPRELARERGRRLYLLPEVPEDAVNILGRLVDEDPSDVDTRVLYARALFARFDREEAVRVLRRGIKETDEPARLYLEWAEIESRSRPKKSSMFRARSAWKSMLGENQAPYLLIDAAEKVSRIFLRTKEEKLGLQVGRELTERVPYHTQSWEIRAAFQLRAGNTSDASQSAQRALELDANNFLAHEIHGHCLLRFGRKDEARAAYKKAVELAEGLPVQERLKDNLRRL